MRKIGKLKNNLFTKFTLTISLLLVSFFLITGTMLIQVVENSILDEVEKGSDKLTRSIAMISAPHIANYTFMFLEQNTLQLQSGKDGQLDILSVQIFDANGYKLNLSGIDTANIKVPRKYWLIKNAPCFIKDMHSNEKRVGYVRIVFSLQSAIERVLHIRIMFIIAVVFIILMLDFLVILLLSKTVIDPINRLKHAATMVSDGDFEIRFARTPKDELGFLMTSFQRMALDLKNSFNTIQDQYRQLQIDHEEIKRSEETLSQLNRCFLELGPNPDYNIQMITKTAGELLDGDFVLYNRFNEETKLIYTHGSWNAPADLELNRSPEGRICYGVIERNDGEVMVIENLEDHECWHTDPTIRKYGIMSFVGVPVSLKNRIVGTLCFFDKKIRIFRPEEINALTMLAQALKNEEERKSYALELKETRNYLRNVFDSLSSSLITIDENYHIIEWNSEADQVFHLSDHESENISIWNAIPALTKEKRLIVRALENQEHINMHRIGIKLDDMLYFDLSVVPLSLRESHGAVIRLDNVTDIVKKDNQLFQAQKMETVGNLAGGLAHDFNNVLCGVTATISLLKYYLEMKKVEDPQIFNYIRTMEQSSNRASEMVQQLLTLSRKQEVSYTAIRLNDAINNVMEICKNTLDKSIHLHLGNIADDAYVNANQTQIEQVLLNLCVNSSHAMTIMRGPDEKKGGRLDISLYKYFVERSFSHYHPDAKEGYYWVCTVHDEGVGMSDEVMRRIFDPFYTTKESSHGTGLGLAMVYNIVKMHNGFINVYSEEGVGSTFQVYLPVLSRRVDVQTLDVPEASLYHGEGKILVVDDEEHIRLISENILTECGYQVFTVVNGQEALDFLLEHPNIDLILLDLSMPVMSGKETFSRIHDQYPDLKVILMSGFRQDSRVNEIMNKGANQFIQKPFTMEGLTRTVYAVMRKNHSGE